MPRKFWFLVWLSNELEKLESKSSIKAADILDSMHIEDTEYLKDLLSKLPPSYLRFRVRFMIDAMEVEK